MSKGKAKEHASSIDNTALDALKIAAWNVVENLYTDKKETEKDLKTARDNLVEYVQSLSLMIYYIQTRDLGNETGDLKLRGGEITFINRVLKDFSELCTTTLNNINNNSSSTLKIRENIFKNTFASFINYLISSNTDTTISLMCTQLYAWSVSNVPAKVQERKDSTDGVAIRDEYGLVIILLIQRAFSALLANYIIVFLQEKDKPSNTNVSQKELFKSVIEKYNSILEKIDTNFAIAGDKAKDVSTDSERSGNTSEYYVKNTFKNSYDIHIALFGSIKVDAKIMFPFHLLYKNRAGLPEVKEKVISMVHLSGAGCYNPITLSDQLFLTYFAKTLKATTNSSTSFAFNYILDPHEVMIVDLSRSLPKDFGTSKWKEPRKFSIEFNPFDDVQLKTLVCLYDIPDVEYKQYNKSKVEGLEPHLIIGVYSRHVHKKYNNNKAYTHKLDVLVFDAEVVHHYTNMFWDTKGYSDEDTRKKLPYPIDSVVSKKKKSVPNSSGILSQCKTLILNTALKRLGANDNLNEPFRRKLFAFTHFATIDYLCFKAFAHSIDTSRPQFLSIMVTSFDTYKVKGMAIVAIEKEVKDFKKKNFVPLRLPKQVCAAVNTTTDNINSVKDLDQEPYRILNQNIGVIPLYVLYSTDDTQTANTKEHRLSIQNTKDIKNPGKKAPIKKVSKSTSKKGGKKTKKKTKDEEEESSEKDSETEDQNRTTSKKKRGKKTKENRKDEEDEEPETEDEKEQEESEGEEENEEVDDEIKISESEKIRELEKAREREEQIAREKEEELEIERQRFDAMELEKEEKQKRKRMEKQKASETEKKQKEKEAEKTKEKEKDKKKEKKKEEKQVKENNTQKEARSIYLKGSKTRTIQEHIIGSLQSGDREVQKKYAQALLVGNYILKNVPAQLSTFEKFEEIKEYLSNLPKNTNSSIRDAYLTDESIATPKTDKLLNYFLWTLASTSTMLGHFSKTLLLDEDNKTIIYENTLIKSTLPCVKLPNWGLGMLFTEYIDVTVLDGIFPAWKKEDPTNAINTDDILFKIGSIYVEGIVRYDNGTAVPGYILTEYNRALHPLILEKGKEDFVCVSLKTRKLAHLPNLQKEVPEFMLYQYTLKGYVTRDGDLGQSAYIDWASKKARMEMSLMALSGATELIMYSGNKEFKTATGSGVSASKSISIQINTITSKSLESFKLNKILQPNSNSSNNDMNNDYLTITMKHANGASYSVSTWEFKTRTTTWDRTLTETVINDKKLLLQLVVDLANNDTIVCVTLDYYLAISFIIEESAKACNTFFKSLVKKVNGNKLVPPRIKTNQSFGVQSTKIPRLIRLENNEMTNDITKIANKTKALIEYCKKTPQMTEQIVPVGFSELLLPENTDFNGPLMGSSDKYNILSLVAEEDRSVIRNETIIDIVRLNEDLVFEGCNPLLDQEKFDALINVDSPVIQKNNVSPKVFANKNNPSNDDLKDYNEEMEYKEEFFETIRKRYKTFSKRNETPINRGGAYEKQMKAFISLIKDSKLSFTNNSTETVEYLNDNSTSSFENALMPVFGNDMTSSSSNNSSGFSTLNSSLLFIWLFSCLKQYKGRDNTVVKLLESKYNSILDNKKIITGRPLLMGRDGGYYSYEDEYLFQEGKIQDYTLKQWIDIRMDCFIMNNKPTASINMYNPITPVNVYKDKEVVEQVILLPNLYINENDSLLIKYKYDYSMLFATKSQAQLAFVRESSLIQDKGEYLTGGELAPLPFIVKKGELLFPRQILQGIGLPIIPISLRQTLEMSNKTFNNNLNWIVRARIPSIKNKVNLSNDKTQFTKLITDTILFPEIEAKRQIRDKNNTMQNCIEKIAFKCGIKLEDPNGYIEIAKKIMASSVAEKLTIKIDAAKSIMKIKSFLFGVLLETWLRMLLDYVLNIGRGITDNTYNSYKRVNTLRSFKLFEHFESMPLGENVVNPIRLLLLQFSSIGLIEKNIPNTITQEDLSEISKSNCTELIDTFSKPLWNSFFNTNWKRNIILTKDTIISDPMEMTEPEAKIVKNPFEAFRELSEAFGYLFFTESEISIGAKTEPVVYTAITPLLVIPELKYVLPELFISLFPSVYLHNLQTINTKEIQMLNSNDQNNGSTLKNVMSGDDFRISVDYAQNVGGDKAKFIIINLVNAYTQRYTSELEKEKNVEDEEQMDEYEEVMESTTEEENEKDEMIVTMVPLQSNPSVLNLSLGTSRVNPLSTNDTAKKIMTQEIVVKPAKVYYSVPMTELDQAYNNSSAVILLRKTADLLSSVVIEALEGLVSTKLAKQFDFAVADLRIAQGNWNELYDVFCAGANEARDFLKKYADNYTTFTKKIETMKNPYNVPVDSTTYMQELLKKLTNSIEEKFKKDLEKVFNSVFESDADDALTEILVSLSPDKQLSDLITKVNVEYSTVQLRLSAAMKTKISQVADQSIIKKIQVITTSWDYVLDDIVIQLKGIYENYPQKETNDIPYINENMEGLFDVIDENEEKKKNTSLQIQLVFEELNRIELGNNSITSSSDTSIDSIETIVNEMFLKVSNAIQATYTNLNALDTNNNDGLLINPDALLIALQSEKNIIMAAIVKLLKPNSLEQQKTQNKINGMIADSLTQHAALYFCDNRKQELISSKSFNSIIPSSYNIHTKIGQFLSDYKQQQQKETIVQMNRHNIRERMKPICYVCLNPATMECGNCSSRQYCSELCSDRDWFKGGHVHACNKIVN